MRFVGIHGLHSNGKESVDLLLSRISLEHYHVHDIDYGHMWAWQTRFSYWRRQAVKRVAYFLQPGDHIIAHSFGCWLVKAALAQWRVKDRPLGQLFMFAPAVDPTDSWATWNCKKVHVFHNYYDKALWMAGVQAFFGGKMGELGRVGYVGPNNPNIVNVNRTYDVKNSVLDHASFVKNGNLEKNTRYILEAVKDNVTS